MDATRSAGGACGLARMEARRLGHHYLSAEHRLLGLLLHGDNLAARVLVAHDLDLEAVHARLQATFGDHADWEAAQRVRRRPNQPVTHTPHSSTDPTPLLCARALNIAAHEAIARDQEVGPERLLLGLLRDAEDPVGTDLASRTDANVSCWACPTTALTRSSCWSRAEDSGWTGCARPRSTNSTRITDQGSRRTSSPSHTAPPRSTCCSTVG